MESRLTIPETNYQKVIAHLLPDDSGEEQAGFVFAAHSVENRSVALDFLDWYPIPPEDFVVQSPGYVELTDECRGRVIKRAHDNVAALVELHSHPWQRKPRFSSSDLSGLDEFVPHVMWRLKNRPYAALVVSRAGFDALIWTNDPKVPELLTEVRVGTKSLRPTGLTLTEKDYKHDY